MTTITKSTGNNSPLESKETKYRSINFAKSTMLSGDYRESVNSTKFKISRFNDDALLIVEFASGRKFVIPFYNVASAEIE